MDVAYQDWVFQTSADFCFPNAINLQRFAKVAEVTKPHGEAFYFSSIEYSGISWKLEKLEAFCRPQWIFWRKAFADILRPWHFRFLTFVGGATHWGSFCSNQCTKWDDYRLCWRSSYVVGYARVPARWSTTTTRWNRSCGRLFPSYYRDQRLV